jgi:N6-adenosine-specific RNA methylase IME4
MTEKSNKLVDILAPAIQGPPGPYRCIYLDPPWPERGGGKSKRGADRHYDTMTVPQIVQIIDEALGWGDHGPGPCSHAHVADDAHCWLWATDNYLRHGLQIMEGMGFRYKRTLVWCKTSPGNIRDIAGEAVECVLDNFAFGHVNTEPAYTETREYLDELLTEWLNARAGGLLRSGLGQYARGAHEILLFGTRGKAHMPPTDVRPKSVQFAPISEHSAKPELFYDIIEACSPGPRLEMFARRRREGWAVFGNEVDDG